MNFYYKPGFDLELYKVLEIDDKEYRKILNIGFLSYHKKYEYKPHVAGKTFDHWIHYALHLLANY